MPWLDRPASVQTRFEVVLHRLDDPMPLMVSHPNSNTMVTYDVWEVRIIYVFDAMQGRWEVQSTRPFGYRRAVRGQARVEIQGSNHEMRALAVRYAPDWIPEPSQAKMRLPAEDVWDEVVARFEELGIPHLAERVRGENPYRAE